MGGPTTHCSRPVSWGERVEGWGRVKGTEEGKDLPPGYDNGDLPEYDPLKEEETLRQFYGGFITNKKR